MPTRSTELTYEVQLAADPTKLFWARKRRIYKANSLYPMGSAMFCVALDILYVYTGRVVCEVVSTSPFMNCMAFLSFDYSWFKFVIPIFYKMPNF